MIRIIDEGILYRNSLPQLRTVHAAFPFVQQISKRELLCSYRRGTAFASIDGVIGKLRSTDGGRTWIEEGLVRGGSLNDHPYSYRGGGLTKLRDGNLLLVSCRFDRSDPNKPLYNPETEGYLPVHAALFRSSDAGYSWSSPEIISLPEGEVGNPAGPVIELKDGRWFIPFETWKNYEDPNPAQQRTVALFSCDKGKTWGDRTPIADGYDQGIFYWDSSIISLKDGRLLALLWTHERETDKDLPIHYVASEDYGRTWSQPESTGVRGETMALLDLGEGCLLMVYSLRNVEYPGIMTVLSEDMGRTWDTKNQLAIWNARDQANIGVALNDRCLAGMSTYAFGKPQVLELSNGDILASFWCTQACVTHIRWCKLRTE